ncbi:hypothetical protein EON64_11760, partial [archaeon]
MKMPRKKALEVSEPSLLVMSERLQLRQMQQQAKNQNSPSSPSLDTPKARKTRAEAKKSKDSAQLGVEEAGDPQDGPEAEEQGANSETDPVLESSDVEVDLSARHTCLNANAAALTTSTRARRVSKKLSV